MKKMKQIIVLLLLIISGKLSAQSIDCEPLLDYRQPDPSFIRNESSQSVQAFTGDKYQFVVDMEKDEQYRFTFFVSAILTRKIQFKIEDINSGQVLLDLPGTTKNNRKNECVLAPYYDLAYDKMIYPYFDFFPKEAAKYRVTIEIGKYVRPKPKFVAVDKDEFPEEEPEEAVIKTFKAPEERRTGCITMYIQQRKACY